MGGYTTDTTNGGSMGTSGTTLGLPMATGATTNYTSRPTILHRPFHSVGELGYVFRGTPWGNINFPFPESGDSALLDVFCINEAIDPNALVAGRVNLNGRQPATFAALLNGSLRDKDDSTYPVLTPTMASALAAQLVTRTMSLTTANPVTAYTYEAMTNRAELVGTYRLSDTTGASPGSGAATKLKSELTSSPFTFTMSDFYTGFSSDIGALPAFQTTATLPTSLIPRQREAAIRALADAGTTRIWNLLIDVVAQSGRYPANATALSKFVVEGEKRYWFHVAIDRVTGKVIDKQLELVEE